MLAVARERLEQREGKRAVTQAPQAPEKKRALASAV